MLIQYVRPPLFLTSSCAIIFRKVGWHLFLKYYVGNLKIRKGTAISGGCCVAVALHGRNNRSLKIHTQDRIVIYCTSTILCDFCDVVSLELRSRRDTN